MPHVVQYNVDYKLRDFVIDHTSFYQPLSIIRNQVSMHPEMYKRTSRNWKAVRARPAREDCFNKLFSRVLAEAITIASAEQILSLNFMSIISSDSCDGLHFYLLLSFVEVRFRCIMRCTNSAPETGSRTCSRRVLQQGFSRV